VQLGGCDMAVECGMWLRDFDEGEGGWDGSDSRGRWRDDGGEEWRGEVNCKRASPRVMKKEEGGGEVRGMRCPSMQLGKNIE